MDINKRIIILLEMLGLTPSEFADKIDVQRSSISHITSGRNKPSLDFLERALTKFPEINSDWLILGKGKPFKIDNIIKQDNIEEEKEDIKYEPTLFSLDEKYVGASSILEIDKTIIDNIEKESEEQLANKTIEEETKLLENISSEDSKKIKKIIIFYSDNSFELYENK